MREALRFTGHIVSASVSRTADHWYVSITVDCPDLSLTLAKNQGVVGIDLGVIALATLSTGETVAGPKSLGRLLVSVRRLSRALSRKVKGSGNRTKARRRLARLYARITHLRREGLHQLITSLTRRFHTIGIEDLNVKGMLQNHCLARVISDMGFGELRRQLEYKAAWRDGMIVVVDRWYPSSKICSNCGHVLALLPLAQRSWTCPACSTCHDRDVNAATNLMHMAVSSTASACGGEGTGLVRKRGVKPALAKQESNSTVNER